MKYKDNEYCPCGSGKTYKECCKMVALKIPEKTQKPVDVQMMERMRKAMKECCLHPDQENCRKPIKHAHALQNNKIMSLLAGTERHVYMLDTKKKPLLVTLENNQTIPFVKISKVSVNKATTETCFCELHDTKAFEIIEAGSPDFDPLNEQMKFVYAYKAFIFEYYKQKTTWEIFQSCFKENPAAYRNSTSVALYRMLQYKKDEFEPIKAHFDNEIMNGTYNGVYTCARKLGRQIKFADYAYVAPTYDMNGRKIKHTVKRIMHRIAITIFPERNHSWILVSCLESEYKMYEDFLGQLEKSSEDKLIFYLNMMLPLLSENMVLSPVLWNAWDEETQMDYTYYANANGSEAMRLEMAVGFGLKNAYRSKLKNVYSVQPKMNIFL